MFYLELKKKQRHIQHHFGHEIFENEILSHRRKELEFSYLIHNNAGEMRIDTPAKGEKH